MFHDPKPYSDYVETGSPWLRRVPSHWGMPRIKTVVREVSDKGHPNEPLLAATQSRGVIRKDQYENRTVEAMNSLETLKLVTVGDFVISLRSFQGGIERAHARGIISPAYTILRPLRANDTDYLTLLFKSLPFIDALRLAVTGIREGQNIEYPRLARDMIPLPPPAEQEAIVTYLAHAHQRIDEAIAAKRRLWDLLQEQKRTAIHCEIASIESSVEASQPLWSLVRHTKAGVWGEDPQTASEGSQVVLCVRVADFDDPSAAVSGSAKTERAITLADLRERSLQPGDLLLEVSGGGAATSVGRVVRYTLPRDAVCSNFIVRTRARQDVISGQYLLHVLRDLHATGQVRMMIKQTTGIQNLDLDEYFRSRIAVPPLSEQAAAVHRIEMETEQINDALRRAAVEVDLLAEFKARISADVVTGQLDVRAVAAALPKIDPAVVFSTSADSASEDDEESFEDDEPGEA